MFKKIVAVFVLCFSFHFSLGKGTPLTVVDEDREGKFGLTVMTGSFMTKNEFKSLSPEEKKEIQKK